MKMSTLLSVVAVVTIILFVAVTAAAQTTKPADAHLAAAASSGRWRPVPCDPKDHPGKCGKHIWMPYSEALSIAAEGLLHAQESHFVIEKETWTRRLLLLPPNRQSLVTVHDIR